MMTYVFPSEVSLGSPQRKPVPHVGAHDAVANDGQQSRASHRDGHLGTDGEAQRKHVEKQLQRDRLVQAERQAARLNRFVTGIVETEAVDHVRHDVIREVFQDLHVCVDVEEHLGHLLKLADDVMLEALAFRGVVQHHSTRSLLVAVERGGLELGVAKAHVLVEAVDADEEIP